MAILRIDCGDQGLRMRPDAGARAAPDAPPRPAAQPRPGEPPRPDAPPRPGAPPRPDAPPRPGAQSFLDAQPRPEARSSPDARSHPVATPHPDAPGGSDPRPDPDAGFDLRAGAAAAGDGPTVVLLHGWRYDPAIPDADPHPLLYRDGPVPAARSRGGRVASWPVGLGLRDAGLAVGYGWRARYPHLAALRGAGCNGFAAAYREAGRAGAALAPLLEALGAARAAPVDVFAHSLGARVALCAIRALAEAGRAQALSRLGRLILLGPAAFAGEARAALDACDRIGAAAPQVYAVHARGNAAFDALFAFAAPPEAKRGDGPLGRAGLGESRPGWIDLAFDHPDAVAAFARLGVGLAPASSGPCHWSFYARPGAMALHRAILARAPGFCPEGLRAAGAPETTPEPAPRRRALRLGWSPRPTPGAAAPA